MHACQKASSLCYLWTLYKKGLWGAHVICLTWNVYFRESYHKQEVKSIDIEWSSIIRFDIVATVLVAISVQIAKIIKPLNVKCMKSSPLFSFCDLDPSTAVKCIFITWSMTTFDGLLSLHFQNNDIYLHSMHHNTNSNFSS